jgi:hypothetical protein
LKLLFYCIFIGNWRTEAWVPDDELQIRELGEGSTGTATGMGNELYRCATMTVGGVTVLNRALACVRAQLNA